MSKKISFDGQSEILVCQGCLQTKVCFPSKPGVWLCLLCEQNCVFILNKHGMVSVVGFDKNIVGVGFDDLLIKSNNFSGKEVI